MLGSLGTVVKQLALKCVIAVILVQPCGCSSWCSARVLFLGNKMASLSRTLALVIKGKWSLSLADDFPLVHTLLQR